MTRGYALNDIKSYRDKELLVFIVANILLFLVVHSYIRIDINDLSKTTEIFSEAFVTVVLSAISYGFILIVECLFTSTFKDKLVYLFGLFSLPGSTVFSNIREKNNDHRFSSQTAYEKYSSVYEKLPANKKKKRRFENENWYLIYAKHREAPIVRASQRDSLLCRDVYISVLSLILMYIVVAVLGIVSLSCPYLVFLFAMAIITNIGANRKASRFVYNVIAYDITSSK